MKRVVCLISVLIMTLLSLCGCSVYYMYKDAEKYSSGAGEITEKIERLDIEWLQGEVQVLPAPEGVENVVLEETASRTMTKNTAVHHYVDGKTLKIRYAKAGESLLLVLKKNLRIYVPNELLSMEIDSESADVRIGKVTTDDCTIRVGSGDGRIDGMTVTRHMACEFLSGNLRGTANCSGADLEFKTGDGLIDFAPTTCRNFSVVMGSGDVTLTFDECPANGGFDMAGGKMNLYLPETADFTLTMEVLSGKLNTDFEYERDGKHYVFGDGTNRFDARAASGAVNIYKK